MGSEADGRFGPMALDNPACSSAASPSPTVEQRTPRSCRASDLSAGSLAVLAPRPATRPTLALLQFLLGPANAALPGHLLLGILHPADEFVSCQGCDVLPGIESRAIRRERLAKVCRKLVHYPTGHPWIAHGITVAGGTESTHRPEVVRHEPPRTINTPSASHRFPYWRWRTGLREFGSGAYWCVCRPHCTRATKPLSLTVRSPGGWAHSCVSAQTR